MSEVTEEAMDGEVDARQETSTRPAPGAVIEGKRTKKTVERLDFQAPKQKEKLKLGDGRGEKLGDIPRVGHKISKTKPADLKPLHAILFDRPGKMTTIRKTLRLFNGFPFDGESEQHGKKREKLLRNFTNNKLKVVCSVLDLEKKGTHSDLVDRIMTFLLAPKTSGKRLPAKKKKKSKKKLSGDETKKTSRTRPRSSSSSPKKSRPGSKSKAIVMDSSSDEDEDEGSDTEDKPSGKEDEALDKSGEEEDEEEEEEESPKSRPGKGKSASRKLASASRKLAPAKRQRTPTKKSGPPRKRPKKDVSDESDPDSDEEPRKKMAAPSKPAAKSKKADSSSKADSAEDSSDDDEPLIKMVKKEAPTEEQLKETVRRLLKEANLEEVTMKQLCQRVFDAYPDHDLSGRKDSIKQTVKSLIT
ncbi:protein DEK [Brachionichthys hirsutus]|uniref:protein DEK n=1 Tax=Brachionichthys hirsutus TaxID=412623 RepID=UPI003604727D